MATRPNVGETLRLGEDSDCMGAGSECSIMDIPPGPQWRVYLSPDRVPFGARREEEREGSRLVVDIVKVQRATVVDRWVERESRRFVPEWLTPGARARIGRLPSPVIYSDGSFRVGDETMALF